MTLMAEAASRLIDFSSQGIRSSTVSILALVENQHSEANTAVWQEDFDSSKVVTQRRQQCVTCLPVSVSAAMMIVDCCNCLLLDFAASHH